MQIDENLKCHQCENIYQNPKSLPCGESMCEFCIRELLNSLKNGQKEFECPLCQSSHAIPNDLQFPDNKSLMKLLNQQPKEIQIHSKIVKDFKASLEENRIKCIDLKSYLINNGIDKVQEHCLNLRISVQLSAETRVKEIHELREHTILEIDKFENDCIKDLSKLILGHYLTRNFNEVVTDVCSDFKKKLFLFFECIYCPIWYQS